MSAIDKLRRLRDRRRADAADEARQEEPEDQAMNPNNELIQAAKAIDAYARPAEADDVLEPSFVPLLANLRTAIARAEASASQPAAVPSEDEIKAFIARVNNAINQMCDPLSPNFARNMVEVRAGMDVIRDRSVEFVRRAAAVHAVPYSCPACGAEMDSSRCWCCGWSNK